MNIKKIRCGGSIPLKRREKRLINYKVKEGVRLICNGAFYDCKKLEHIELPSSINFIGDKNSAFAYHDTFFCGNDCWKSFLLQYYN